MRRLCAYLLVLKYSQLLKDKEQENKSEAFSYDSVGNRLTGPRANDYYAYNNGNQLTNDRKHQYEYDNNGNLIKKVEINDDNKQEIWLYEYDYENRLIKVEKSRKGDGCTSSLIR
ncbi:MAG: hypothetical protein WC855_13745 [Thermodesulfovibrionales bacterium]